VKYLGSIQILRGLAALAVTIAHTNGEVSWWAVNLHYENPMPGLVTGAAGVDLFFVISGFIMVYTTAESFGTPTASGVFLLRRIIRIVPLYWIATFLFLAYIVRIGHSWAMEGIGDKNVLCSFVFIACPRPNGGYAPALEVGWSLNYEMFFYLCFAVALLLPRRIGLACMVTTLTYVAHWPLPFDVPASLQSTARGAGAFLVRSWSSEWHLGRRSLAGVPSRRSETCPIRSTFFTVRPF